MSNAAATIERVATGADLMNEAGQTISNPQPQITLIQQTQRLPATHPQFVIQPQMQQLLINPAPHPQPSAEKKQLSLSREQMLEAQDMFRNSNKVTRPEKALILGFMAGSRENPCPHLGNTVTIKLSENEEQRMKPDGTFESVFVETHYQMNYATGEGKRIKKYHRVGDAQSHPGQNVHLSQTV